MSRLIRGAGLTAVAYGLLLSAAVTPAWAQKSGGGGGGGGSKVATTTILVPLVGPYYSTGVSGAASLTFDATQTSRSMLVSVNGVNMPDGAILHVELRSDGLVQPTSYYPIYLPQTVADLTLAGGSVSASLDTAAGDHVPLFGTFGTISVSAHAPDGTFLGYVVSGSYSSGKKQGGKP